MKNGPYELIVPPADYPGKRYRGKYAYEHIVVFWQTHGRMPERGNVVHHKNEAKRDNEPHNLEEKTVGQHNADHHCVDDVVVPCGWCNGQANIRPRNYRWRTKNGQTVFYCSRSCQVRAQQKMLREKRLFPGSAEAVAGGR